MDPEQNDQDIKEDFSGLTEVTVKDPQHQPQNLPPRIDVSEEIAQAQSQEQHQQSLERAAERATERVEGNYSQKPQEGYLVPPTQMQMNMMRQPPQQRPSFWNTLMTRGLTILAVVAVGFIVWWWWSSTKSINQAAGDAVNTVTQTVKDNVVNPVKRALNLPPSL